MYIKVLLSDLNTHQKRKKKHHLSANLENWGETTGKQDLNISVVSQIVKLGLSQSDHLKGMNVNSSSLHLKSLGYWEVSQENIPQ